MSAPVVVTYDTPNVNTRKLVGLLLQAVEKENEAELYHSSARAEPGFLRSYVQTAEHLCRQPNWNRFRVGHGPSVYHGAHTTQKKIKKGC